MVGRLLDTPNEEDKFINFKSEMNEKYLKKYIEVNRNQSRNTLAVVYNNKLYSLWNKLIEFIQRKTTKNKAN